MNKSSQTPIIVRRRKPVKAEHHGGSWKIAYADFMTVMMAFFMVMWLLSTSTPEQRQGIADYFKTPLKIALGKGDKASFSDSVIPGGGDDLIKQQGEVLKYHPQNGTTLQDRRALQQAYEQLQSLIRLDPRLAQFSANIRFSLTDDGLLIQIIDSQDRPMFALGSKQPEPYMRSILLAMAPVISSMPNKIVLSGHTDSLRYSAGDSGYSNWELSTDRASAVRRILATGGMAEEKFLRVMGSADRMSPGSNHPDDPINRRISVLVLSKQKEQSIMAEDRVLPTAAPAALIAAPSVTTQDKQNGRQ